MARNRLVGNWLNAVTLGLLGLGMPIAVRADESEAQKQERLTKMSSEQKLDLLGKQQRFLELKPDGQERLRELHSAVMNDPHSKHLEDTIRRYNQWLANLSSAQRAAVLSIADPKVRIAKIKELIQQQEEQRFRQFVQEEVSPQDREAIYTWLGLFVNQQQDEIRKRMDPGSLRRLDESPDDAARRRNLIMTWGWQAFVRRIDAPLPSKADYDQLLRSLTESARKQITAKPELREQRLENLVRAAVFSLSNPPPSHEELKKFYTSMPADDPRRERLESLEGEDFHKELLTIFNQERFGRRGGFQRGGRGGPGGPGRGGEGPGRGGDGQRGDGPGRGGDGPPGEFRPPGKGNGGPGKGGDGRGGEGRDDRRGDGKPGEGQRPPPSDGTRPIDGPPAALPPPPPTGEPPAQP